MQIRDALWVGIVFLLVLGTNSVQGTNGAMVIGVGAASRSMGGVGIAEPVDVLGATFLNPAGLSFLDRDRRLDVSGTFFYPRVTTRVTNPDGTSSAESRKRFFLIPAIAYMSPIGGRDSAWTAALAANGVSGLGVNYNGTAIDQAGAFPAGPGSFPLVASELSNLQVLRVTPSVAYEVRPNLSLGVSGLMSYGMLDLGRRTKGGVGFGVQPGVTYRPTSRMTLGFSYISPQNVPHSNVLDLDGNGSLDELKLESPNQFGIGVSHEFYDSRLRVELNAKWLQWSQADGYSDFDWDNQWVFGIGAEYELAPNRVYLRAGYNFGENPVRTHNGWQPGFQNVQGKSIPNYYYETFRVVGFPAIVEHHVSAGIGFRLNERVEASVAVMHALKESIRQTGTDLFGRPTTLESELSEVAVELSVSFLF